MDEGFRRLSGEWMTPRRRFLSALYGGRVDKVPAMTLSSVITLEAMDIADAAFPEAHLDADKIARLAATAHENLGLDTLMPVFHSQLEADALDAATWWGTKDNWPAILAASGVEPISTVIMGTVQGDLHDIAKNLCTMMLRGGGFTVINLGVNTSPDEFLEAVRTSKARLVGMSALLTTTMPNMAKTVEAFKDAGLRDQVRFMVGGAPVTPEFGKAVGADGYGKDALACVELAKKLAVEVSL